MLAEFISQNTDVAPPHPDIPTVSYFTSFAVPEGIPGTSSSILNCQNSMKDSKGRIYTFKLKGLPSSFPNNPFPTPPERQAVNSKLKSIAPATPARC